MCEKEFCSISDIPQKIVIPPEKRKPRYKSKWHNIINELLESEAECLKITPIDITARNASIGLASYIKTHSCPIKYCQRGDSIYIYKIKPEE